MKLTDKTKTIIILIIAFIMIGMGLVQGVFGVELNEEVANQISFVLMIIAAGLFFSRKRGQNVEEADDSDENNNKE